MYEWAEQVEDGGPKSYGSSLAWAVRRVAASVDLVVNGIKPGELPVEQPSQVECVVNLKAAWALGLVLPPSLLLRADKVIQ